MPSDFSQIAFIQRPGQVGQLQPAVAHRPGAAKACGDDLFPGAPACSSETPLPPIQRAVTPAPETCVRAPAPAGRLAKLYSARWTFVPPTSPARIIRDHPTFCSAVRSDADARVVSSAQNSESTVLRCRKLRRRGLIQQEEKLTIRGADQLRRHSLRIARPGQHLVPARRPCPRLRSANTTSRAWLITGHVSVMRQVSFCGTWLAITSRLISSALRCAETATPCGRRGPCPAAPGRTPASPRLRASRCCAARLVARRGDLRVQLAFHAMHVRCRQRHLAQQQARCVTP